MKDLIERYNKIAAELAAARREAFPIGSTVIVDCRQYHGRGTVANSDGCALNQLPVQVGSGNVWWYPLEDCTPEPPPKAGVKT